MNNPDSPDHPQACLAHDLLFNLKSKTSSVLSDITLLLERGAIEDETDRSLVMEAAAFIENPTENLSDIMKHTTSIGQVLGGYEMQGTDLPVEIDAMHAYLFALQCVNRIDFVEKELESGSPDLEKIKFAIVQALDWTTILSSGYKDDTFLTAVNELQNKLNNL